MKNSLIGLFAFAVLLTFAFAAQDSTQPATTDNPPPIPGGCYDDRDCPAGQLCINDTCVSVPASCGNNICAEGEFCYNCPSDCGACPPGSGGSGGHDPPPMQPNYPPTTPTQPAGDQPQNDGDDGDNSAPPPTLGPGVPPSQQPAPTPSDGKEPQKQDIIADVTKALGIDGFFNTLAAAIGNIPPALVIGLFVLFVIVGAAGGYIFLTRKKEEK